MGSYVSRAQSIGSQMSNLYSDVLGRVTSRREKDSPGQLSTFMDRVLDAQEKNALPPNQLRFIGGVLMEGGSDTSSSLIIAIVQAMIHYPEVQRKAHAQIDEVVGAGRSPQWSDLERLPYINMIVKEGHRWRPILPLCFPHALGEGEQASSFDGIISPCPSSLMIVIFKISILTMLQTTGSTANSSQKAPSSSSTPGVCTWIPKCTTTPPHSSPNASPSIQNSPRYTQPATGTSGITTATVPVDASVQACTSQSAICSYR